MHIAWRQYVAADARSDEVVVVWPWAGTALYVYKTTLQLERVLIASIEDCSTMDAFLSVGT